MIKSFRHAGLRRLVLADDRSAFPPAVVDKLRRMILFLEAATTPAGLREVPTWKVHQLGGDAPPTP